MTLATILIVAVHAGFGGFETVTSSADAGALAQALERSAIAHHGTAAPAFINWVAAQANIDPLWIGTRWNADLAAFTRNHVPPGADGQVRRAARRFALAALAGEMATEAGITGWVRGEAERAAAACFRSWMEQRGTVGGREAQQIAEALRRFITEHGASRFEAIREAEADDVDAAQTEPPLPEGRSIVKRAGWRWQETKKAGERFWIYGIEASIFAQELCQPLGMTPSEARQKLVELEIIQTEQRGGEAFRRTTVRRRVKGVGRVELVTVNPAVWGADDPA